MPIRAFLQSIYRYLRKNGYPLSLLNDREFDEVQDILTKKQNQLKSIGKGNKPNSADPLTYDEIEQLYSDGVLGNTTPRALLNTVWLNNCIFFLNEAWKGTKRPMLGRCRTKSRRLRTSLC